MAKWKILLADDDPEDREMIKDALDNIEAGDVIRFAENGEQALDILSKESDLQSHACLIVLDLNMPRMNGTETLRKLKTDDRFKSIPVIIFSTSINELEKQKCMRLGAHSYITKPVSYRECLATAEKFMKFCGQIH
jgi:CheY-like chemotaxis protein